MFQRRLPLREGGDPLEQGKPRSAILSHGSMADDQVILFLQGYFPPQPRSGKTLTEGVAITRHKVKTLTIV